LMSAALFLSSTVTVSMVFAVSLALSFASVCMMLNASWMVVRSGVLSVLLIVAMFPLSWSSRGSPARPALGSGRFNSAYHEGTW
jgi:hypothetical protein